jgi:DNA-binding CsgD family transcriptional regulator
VVSAVDWGAATEVLRARTAHLPPTPQQLLFLRLRSHGLTLEQVAWHLGISADTAKTHSRRLHARLGAVNAAHAVRIGFERGYLTADDAPASSVPVPEEDLRDEGES